VNSPTPANIVLFPLCDRRGLVSQMLRDADSAAALIEPENLFFAWLLDLPVDIDPAQAARAVIAACALDLYPIEPGQQGRRKLYELLLNACGPAGRPDPTARSTGLRALKNAKY